MDLNDTICIDKKNRDAYYVQTVEFELCYVFKLLPKDNKFISKIYTINGSQQLVDKEDFDDDFIINKQYFKYVVLDDGVIGFKIDKCVLRFNDL